MFHLPRSASPLNLINPSDIKAEWKPILFLQGLKKVEKGSCAADRKGHMIKGNGCCPLIFKDFRLFNELQSDLAPVKHLNCLVHARVPGSNYIVILAHSGHNNSISCLSQSRF